MSFVWLLAGLLIADRQPDIRKMDSEVSETCIQTSVPR